MTRAEIEAEIGYAKKDEFDAGQRVRRLELEWADRYAQLEWNMSYPGCTPVGGSFLVTPGTGKWCFWKARDASGKNTWGYLW